MRRFQIVPVLVASAILGGSAAAVRPGHAHPAEAPIVIPQEVLIELQRLAHETFGEDALQGSEPRDHAARCRTSAAGWDTSAALRSPTAPSIQDKDFHVEQTDRQTKTLAIGANGSLELKNIVGDITVKAGGGREATVEIVRVSRGQTDADAKARTRTRDGRSDDARRSRVGDRGVSRTSAGPNYCRLRRLQRHGAGRHQRH